MINPILEQTLYYAIVMLLSVFLVSLLQKGFFMNFLRAKISFGRLIIIKLKAVNRDHFAVGKIEDGFLIFKCPDGLKRLCIPDGSVFYRALGIAWIDIDEEKNAICKPDYSTVTGFDAAKFQNLFVRTLYKPSIKDNTTKILIGCMILAIIGIIGIGFAVYKQNYLLQALGQQISQLKGVITAASNVIK